MCDITDDCLDCCVPTGHHKHWDCFYDFLPVVYPSLHHRYCISQYPQTTPVVLYCRRGERGIPSHLVSPLQQEHSPACANIPADRTDAGSPISHTEVNIANPKLQLCLVSININSSTHQRRLLKSTGGVSICLNLTKSYIASNQVR